MTSNKPITDAKIVANQKIQRKGTVHQRMVTEFRLSMVFNLPTKAIYLKSTARR